MGDACRIADGIKVQGKVIGALLLREAITRYGRHGLGVLWLVLEPMMFTMGVAALWYISSLHVYSSIPIIAFAITGYSSVLVWRNAANRCTKAIVVNLGLMYHRNVKVVDILLSRVLLEVIGGTASIIILTSFFSFIGAMAWPVDVLTVIAGWLLLCWFAIAMGMIVGAITERSEVFDRVWHILTYLLFPLSGAVYMVHWLPDAVQSTVTFLPMVNGVEMLRHGYFGDLVPTYEDPTYFIFFNLVLTLLGLLLVRQTAFDSSTSMIKLIDIHKLYATRSGYHTVLKGINLAVEPGEKIGILGGNGAGKSTLIRILSGAEQPTHGKVIRDMNISWPLAFGGAFQGGLSGMDNLRFVCRIYNVDIKKTIDFVESFSELGKFLHEPVKNYSNGMRARLAFALSMAVDFDCYLIDEIVAVGDRRFHDKCHEELFIKRKAKSMIIVSHDPHYIREHCTKACVLIKGDLRHFDEIDDAYYFFDNSLC